MFYIDYTLIFTDGSYVFVDLYEAALLFLHVCFHSQDVFHRMPVNFLLRFFCFYFQIYKTVLSLSPYTAHRCHARPAGASTNTKKLIAYQEFQEEMERI